MFYFAIWSQIKNYKQLLIKMVEKHLTRSSVNRRLSFQFWRCRSKMGKSDKNNNQIERSWKWDLTEWSRPTPGSGCLFKEDLISQFTKELSFKKYFDRQQRAPRFAVSLTRYHRIFPRDLFERRAVILFVPALSHKVKRWFISTLHK